jgi:hypothetical protein
MAIILSLHTYILNSIPLQSYRNYTISPALACRTIIFLRRLPECRQQENMIGELKITYGQRIGNEELR